MEWVINGGRQLNGVVAVQGAKNSALPILAATALCRRPCVLKHCPDLSDVHASLHILTDCGADCTYANHTATVNSAGLSAYTVTPEQMQKMRSSILFSAPLLSRFGRAVVGMPGGCALGDRPIDLHLSALKQMGAVIETAGNRLICTAPGGLHGAEITLPLRSVGATESILLAAAAAKGKTVLHHAAFEPEIADLAAFLNACGAKITGIGTDCITVRGVEFLHGTEYEIMPDRIAAATYLCAGAAAGGTVTLTQANGTQLQPMLAMLRAAGCRLTEDANALRLEAPNRLSALPPITTAAYPGFPTDAGPLAVALMSIARGQSYLHETVFNNRFRYVRQLQKMGADITVKGQKAIVNGMDWLFGTAVECTDLRGGAAVVLAALAAEGQTTVGAVEHLLRGYENMEKILTDLGADVRIK